VAFRNIRRDAVDQLRQMEKSKELSRDDSHLAQEQVQKLTDAHIGQMDTVGRDKEAEVMEV